MELNEGCRRLRFEFAQVLNKLRDQILQFFIGSDIDHEVEMLVFLLVYTCFKASLRQGGDIADREMSFQIKVEKNIIGFGEKFFNKLGLRPEDPVEILPAEKIKTPP